MSNDVPPQCGLCDDVGDVGAGDDMCAVDKPADA